MTEFICDIIYSPTILDWLEILLSCMKLFLISSKFLPGAIFLSTDSTHDSAIDTNNIIESGSIARCGFSLLSTPTKNVKGFLSP
jgi:hypothetical protein